MNRAKQLIIALMCGFDRDHELVKSAIADQEILAKSLLEASNITPDDLFSPTETGASIFQYPETFSVLPKLIACCRDNGHPVTGADFLRPIGGGKSAFDHAQTHKCVDAILLNTKLWEGNFLAFQSAWFSVHKVESEQAGFLPAKRAILAAEGKIPREDQLARMGISISEVKDAFKSGNYTTINKKFHAGGDCLRRDDICLVDYMGDTILFYSDIWEKADKLWAELAQNNELPDVDDLIYKCDKRDSILERAVSTDKLEKLFDYTLWQGRPISEVMRLYNHVSLERRKKVPLEILVNKMAEKMFVEEISAKGNVTRQELIDAFHSDMHTGSGMAVVRPLAFEKVLEKIDLLQESLRQNGDPLSLADFRLASGEKQEPILVIAARGNNFRKVLSLISDGGESLSLSDLALKDGDGKMVIQHLHGKGILPDVLQPQDWIGRGQELGEVWKLMRQVLPIAATDAIDFTALQGTVSMLSVRRQAAARGLLPQP